MVDLQQHLGVDLELALHEHVEGMGDHPFGGVLHRHHPVLGPSLFHLFEHCGDGFLGHEFGGKAELLQGGLVGKGRLRAEKRHFHRRFQGKRCGNDLAKNASESFVGKRAGIMGDEALVDLPLAAGNVKIALFARP